MVGIFALTLFDSSLLFALPGIADLVIITFVITKASWPWAALATLFATAGSLAGALMIYRMANKTGGGLLRRRFPAGLIARVEGWTDRLGAVPVCIAAVMPPPFPYVPFVISAGVMRVPRVRFGSSVALGRGVRYGLDSTLAMLVGHRLLQHLHSFYWSAFKIVVFSVAVVLVVWAIFRLQFRGSLWGDRS